MILWRISNYADLSGHGGLLHRGRWHNRGRPIVYLAESAAGALLEVLVHAQASHPSELPRDFQLLEVEVPAQATIGSALVPDKVVWQHDLNLTRRLGDRWLHSAPSLLLRVPSAVLGRTDNWLLNPAHPQAVGCHIASALRYPFDARLSR